MKKRVVALLMAGLMVVSSPLSTSITAYADTPDVTTTPAVDPTEEETTEESSEEITTVEEPSETETESVSETETETESETEEESVTPKEPAGTTTPGVVISEPIVAEEHVASEPMYRGPSNRDYDEEAAYYGDLFKQQLTDDYYVSDRRGFIQDSLFRGTFDETAFRQVSLSNLTPTWIALDDSDLGVSPDTLKGITEEHNSYGLGIEWWLHKSGNDEYETVKQKVFDRTGKSIEDIETLLEQKFTDSEEYRAAFDKALEEAIEQYPYKFFWYDRSKELEYEFASPEIYLYGEDARIYVKWASIAIYLPVLPQYQAEGYDGSILINKKKLQDIYENNYNYLAWDLRTYHRYQSEENISEYARLKGYIDVIGDVTDYDADLAAGGWNSTYSDAWEIVNVVDQNEDGTYDLSTKTVGEGYAKAFQWYAADRDYVRNYDLNHTEAPIAIPTIRVSGTVKVDDGSACEHQWNIVTFNGNRYIVDTAMSDYLDDVVYLRGASVSGNSMTVTTDEHTLVYTYDEATVAKYEETDLAVSTTDVDYSLYEDEVALPAPDINAMEMEVLQPDFGKVELRWHKRYDAAGQDLYVHGYKVFFSETENGSYTAIGEEVLTEDIGYSNYSHIITDAIIDSETGLNKIGYYKLAVVDTDGRMSKKSDAVTNNGVSYGEPASAQATYNGLRFVDKNGNSISNPLTIHVDEAVKVGFEAINKDATKPNKRIQKIEDIASMVGADYIISDDTEYSVKKLEGSRLVDVGTDSPVKRIRTNDTLDGVMIYLKGMEVTSEEDHYYLCLHSRWEDLWGDCRLIIPLKVEAHAEGVNYNNPPEVVFCKTRAQAYQAIRDIITSRTNNSAQYGFSQNSGTGKQKNAGRPYNNYVYDRILVKDDVFGSASIMMKDVCDFENERAGMKPNEGEYIYHCIGDSQMSVTHWENITPIKTTGMIKDEKGDYYSVYEVYLPMITTKAEEAAVDAKIASLMNSTFAGVKNGTDEQKISAIYNYITSNVNGTVSGAGGSDRTYPKYHTAYHALIKGNGTCESFAMLFSRLARELGVPARVIMGVDANNHTYNIVRNGSYWYFIDCNTGRYLTDNSFSRAKEQDIYLTQGFINTYYSKLKGSTYTAKPDGITVVTYGESGEVLERFSTNRYDEVHDHIRSGISADTVGKNKWVIQLNGNLTLKEGQSICFEDAPDRVSLDLQKHTLTTSGHSLQIGCAEIGNGTITLPKAANRYESRELLLGTNQGKLAQMNLHDLTFSSPARDRAAVSFQTRYEWDYTGPQSCRIDYNIDNVAFNNLSVHFQYAGNYDAIYAPQVEVVNVLGNLTFNNCALDPNGIYESDHFKPGEFNIVRQYESAGQAPIKEGKIVFNNTDLTEYNCYDGTNYSVKGLILHPVDIIGGVTSDGTFMAGDVILSVAGNFRYANEAGKLVAFTEDKILEMISVPEDTSEPEHKYIEDGYGVICDDRSVLIGKEGSVILYKYEDGVKKPVNQGGYSTIKKAIAAINTTGEYEIELGGAAKLMANTTIPAAAAKVTLTTAIDGNSGDHISAPVNMGGFTLTYAGKGTIELADGCELFGGTLNVSNLNITGAEATGGVFVDSLTATGSVSVADNSSFRVGTLNMKSGVFTNLGNTVAENTASLCKLDNKSGAYFETDKMAMVTTGGLYLEPASIMHVNENALIYNIYLGQDASGNPVDSDVAASLTRLGDTVITINSKIAKKKADNKLAVLTVADTDKSKNVGTPGQTILFNTNIKAFPLDDIELIQPPYITDQTDPAYVANAIDYTKYNTLNQSGNSILVATDWIMLYADGKLLITFAKWSEAVSYVNTISNAAVDYTLVLSEDVTTCENMTFPSKAKSFTLKGTDPNSPIKITYLGNISLTTNTTFENLILAPKSYNAKTAVYSDNNASSISFNGKAFKWINTYSTNSFASVSGSGASSFELNSEGKKTDAGKKMSLTVNNAISVPTLTLDDYALNSVNNALTVGNDAYLKSADIDVKTNITIKNLHTLDANNTMSYAVAANNSMSISGVVDTKNADGTDSASADIPVNVRYEDDILGPDEQGNCDDKDDATVSSNAISISVKYIESAKVISDNPAAHGHMSLTPGTAFAYGTRIYVMTHYTYTAKNGTFKANTDYTTKSLVNSAKAPATYFVIGRKVVEGNTTVQYATKKVGNAIRVETSGNLPVTLCSGASDVMGNYATLQEAFNDIERYSDKQRNYTIYIDAEESIKDDHADTKSFGKITKNNANLATPKNVATVTITNKPVGDPSDPQPKAVIYSNNTLTLNSNLELDNVILANKPVTDKYGKVSYTKLNINLGGFELTLNDVNPGATITCNEEDDTYSVSESRTDRIGNITGNGVGVRNDAKRTNTSVLKLNATSITVNGNLNNVKTLDMGANTVTVTGSVNVGDVKSKAGATLIATATLKTATDKKSPGVVFVNGVNPNVTVNGLIESEVPLDIKLQALKSDKSGYVSLPDGAGEGAAASYATILGKEESSIDRTAMLAGVDYHVIKAPCATATSVKHNGYTTTVTLIDGKDYKLIKNGGFICLSTATLAYSLSYADGNEISDFITFADAVTEINNRNDKNADYLIETAGNSIEKSEAFTMPAAGKLNSLTIRGTADAIEKAYTADDQSIVEPQSIPGTKLYYSSGKNAVNKLALTTNTTLDNVIFVDAEQATKANAGGEYPERPALSIVIPAGKNLKTIGMVAFAGRGITINGSKTATLDMSEGNLTAFGDAMTLGGYEEEIARSSHDKQNVISGSLMALGELKLKGGDSLRIDGHATAVNKSGVATKGASGSLQVTKLDVNSNSIYVSHYNPAKQDATITVNDLTVTGSGNKLYTYGTTNLTNVGYSATSYTKDGKQYPGMEIFATGNTNIKGNLNLDNDGLRITAKSSNKPFINVSGTVTGDHKAVVTISDSWLIDTGDSEYYPSMEATPTVPSVADGSMLPLMTSAKGNIDHFDTGNNTTRTEEGQPVKAKVIKLGSTLYAADNAAIRVVVARTDTISATDIKSDIDGIPELVMDGFAVKLADYDDEGQLKTLAGLKEVDAFGYYPSFGDAVTAINSIAVGKNDPKPQYAIILLDDVYDHMAAVKRLESPTDPVTETQKEICPIKVIFPTAGKASRILITGSGEVKDLYFNNALSLTSDLVLNNTRLVASGSKTENRAKVATGAKLNLSTGNYTLTVAGVWDVTDYDFEDGSKSMIGSVTTGKTGSLRLIETNLTTQASVNIAKLELASGSCLYVTGPKATATITDIVNDLGDLFINRGALTIGGVITGGPLDITVNTGYEKSGFDCLFTAADRAKNGSFPANKKLFTGAKLSTKDVEVSIEDFDGSVMESENSAGGKTVKVLNDFYQVADDLADNMVSMKIVGDDDSMADYLDVNSALAQINTWNDPNASYVITIDDVEDVNVRDTVVHSAIVMPGDNKAGRITFTDGYMMYSGNITAYGGFTSEGEGEPDGGLVFDGIDLEPVNAKNDTKGTCNISLIRNKNDKSGTPVLEFKNMEVGAICEGHIANISGTKGVTDVCTNSELVLTGSFSNVGNITTDGAEVVAGGKAGAVGDLILKGTSPAFTSIGAITVPNVVLDEATSPMLGTVSGGATNQFTISGGVLDASGKALPNDKVINICTYKSKITDPANAKKSIAISLNNLEAYDFNYYEDCTGVNLINAPKAWAGYFRHSYLDANEFTNYKIGAGVYTDLYKGNEDNWQAKVVWKDTENELPTDKNEFVTYAHSYAEAVADITTYAMQRDYTIELLNTGTDGISIRTANKPVASSVKSGEIIYPIAKDTENDVTGIGALTLPTYKVARSLVITSNAGNPIDTNRNMGPISIKYTGNITPSTNVTFDNVTLNNGSLNKAKAFIPAGKVNAAMTTGFDLTLNENVKIKTTDGMIIPGKENAKSLVNIASGAKGIVTVRYEDGDPVEVKSVKFVGKNVISDNGNTNVAEAIEIEHEGITTSVATWNDAVTYINAIGDKTVEYTLVIKTDLFKDNSRTPLASFAIPAAAKKITITNGDSDTIPTVSFVGNKLNVQTNVELHNVELNAFAYNKKTKEYDPIAYSLAVGNNFAFDITGQNTAADGTICGIDSISGGTLNIESADTSEQNRLKVNVNKTVNMRTLNITDANLSTANGALTISVSGELTGADVIVGGNSTIKNVKMDDAKLISNGNVSANATTLDDSKIVGRNIAMTGLTSMASSTLDAGMSDAVGNGKLTLANVEFRLYKDGEMPYNEFIVKQDKNGTSMLTISGTVTTKGRNIGTEEEPEIDEYTTAKRAINLDNDPAPDVTAAALIRLVYNNRSTDSIVREKPVQSNVVPYDGMVYATFANAKNANNYVRKVDIDAGSETDPGLFAGVYTDVYKKDPTGKPINCAFAIVSDVKAKAKTVTCKR